MRVRAVLAILRADGWELVKTVGSHRQFKHPHKPGKVTVPGNDGEELKPGTLASIWRQAGLERERP